MHIRRVQIHTVRGFTEVDLDLRRSDDKLAGWTVIAGRNGAGKSTLLKAIALAAAGPASSRSLQESFAGWIRSGEAEAAVTLKLCWDKAQDRFHEGGKHPKDYFEASLAWKRNGGEEPHFTSEDAKGKKLSPRRGPWADNPLGWVVLGYGPFRRASGEAVPAQRLMSGPPRLADSSASSAKTPRSSRASPGSRTSTCARSRGTTGRGGPRSSCCACWAMASCPRASSSETSGPKA